MPRLTHALPKYRLHRATGQAVVTIDRRDYYLGLYGSQPSRRAYDQLIAEWLAAGRAHRFGLSAVPLILAELLLRWHTHAIEHYCKHGEVTREVQEFKYALRP